MPPGKTTRRSVPLKFYGAFGYCDVFFAGLEARQDSIFVDLGPSGTMATVAKYNLRPSTKSEMLSVMSPFTNEWAGFETVRRRLGV